MSLGTKPVPLPMKATHPKSSADEAEDLGYRNHNHGENDHKVVGIPFAELDPQNKMHPSTWISRSRPFHVGRYLKGLWVIIVVRYVAKS